MANVQTNGFRPWGTFSNGQGMPGTRVQEVANNNTLGVFVGDVIKQLSDGTVYPAAASDNGVLCGIVVGCSYIFQGRRLTSNFIPAATTFSPTTVGSRQASLVEFVPLTGETIFKVRGFTATATTLATQVALIGENADMDVGAGGDTTTGVSSFSLAVAGHATTTLNFRIIGIDGYVLEDGIAGTLLDQDVSAVSFDYLVTCNEGFYPPYSTSGI
jgi:hypothetical protein